MGRLALATLLTVALLLPGLSATAYTVTLGGGPTSFVRTDATGGTVGVVSETVNLAALPYSYTSTVVSGLSSSEPEYDFSNAAFEITL